ncbi:MAG: riboflavin synthase [Synergistaceae bacterium]|jgi:riboflavin synthase|nr:riboflavin synthase [Synergistaceae bacterium]
MFTGIIETVGIVNLTQQKNDVLLLGISAPKISNELKRGDSVSIDGACSTVVNKDITSFYVEIMKETLIRTNFGELTHGSRVNLERAMRLNMRLDGHFVSGHVDGTAKVSKIESYGKTKKYTFTVSEKKMLEEIIPKGSIAINGISLTVIEIENNNFTVGLIPTTLTDTTFLSLKNGDTVNIETDMLGKYVLRYLKMKKSDKNEMSENDSLTWDELENYGWI